MREPYTQLYVHLVWATWDRLPLITPKLEPRIYAAVAEKCREHKCLPIAIGGIEDHMHVLTIMLGAFFKWQGAYGAFTIRKSEVPTVKAYIENQKQHHAENRLFPELEEVFEQDDE
jgi:REP element-mobilizing transposase RayT